MQRNFLKDKPKPGIARSVQDGNLHPDDGKLNKKRKWGKVMFKWFRDCRYAEQGKKLYHELAKKYHSDNGGNDETLKEINAEFREWWSNYKDIHKNVKTGETFTSEKETNETADMFIEIVAKLSTLSGIEVEACGSWLWISGNTYPVREQLREFGCRWSKGKKKWYWTADEYIRTRYHLSMNDIRIRYGSQQVTLEKRLCIE